MAASIRHEVHEIGQSEKKRVKRPEEITVGEMNIESVA